MSLILLPFQVLGVIEYVHEKLFTYSYSLINYLMMLKV